MESILSDRGTYEVVNKAPFNKVERELNAHLLRLKKEQKLDNNTNRKLRSTDAIPPAIRGSVRHHAGHKRHEKRTCCCNFVNNFSIEPNFFRDVEDIILTNLFFFVFGIVTFWREKYVANFATFFKFHKNDDNRKLKAWSFRLRKNDFCRLYNERARALQSSITFFFIHPVEKA